MVKVLENQIIDLDLFPGKEQQELKKRIQEHIDRTGYVHSMRRLRPPPQRVSRRSPYFRIRNQKSSYPYNSRTQAKHDCLAATRGQKAIGGSAAKSIDSSCQCRKRRCWDTRWCCEGRFGHCWKHGDHSSSPFFCVFLSGREILRYAKTYLWTRHKKLNTFALSQVIL